MGKSLACCTQTWRLVFVVLNILFTLIGLAMIAIGIWLIVDGSDFDFITEKDYASPAAILIATGVITTVISIVGVIGALGMWYCVLVVYITFMVIVVILQITAGALGAAFRDNLTDLLEDRFSDAISDYSVNDTSSDENRVVDAIQEEFECCGLEGPEDWINTTFASDSGQMFPESCECSEINCDECAPFGEVCNETTMSSNLIWTAGCDSRISDQLEDNLGVIAGVGVAFGIFELSGVAISLGLCICACMKRNKDDDYPVDEYVY